MQGNGQSSDLELILANLKPQERTLLTKIRQENKIRATLLPFKTVRHINISFIFSNCGILGRSTRRRAVL